MLYFVLHIGSAISIKNVKLYTFGTQISKNRRGSHSHLTISARPQYRRSKGAVRYLCDFYARLQRRHDDRMISLRSLHGLSKALRRSVIKTVSRKPVKEIARWQYKCKHIGSSPQSCNRCLKTLRKILDK